jgi:hypothetical protein
MFNVALKTYGRGTTKKWIRNNQYFFDYTKAITNAGRTLELAAKKTAEDIKEKFRQIELSSAAEHQKTHL